MINADTIKEYWRTSQLAAIADYDDDGLFDKEVVESAIQDAYKELHPLIEYQDENTIDLFAKRLTICILLSRLNINPEAVALPLADCREIRKQIDAVISRRTQMGSESDIRKKSAGILVSHGTKPLSDIIEGY